MRVLIWCPHVNLGGGKRLLNPIITALAKHPEIQKVRVVIPDSASDILPPPNVKIEVIKLNKAQANGWMGKYNWRFQSGKLRTWRAFFRYQRDKIRVKGLLDALEKDMDVVYVFWPHTVPYFNFKKPTVCMFQDVTLLDFPEIIGGRATAFEYTNLKNWLLNSTEVVVSSPYTARRIETHFDIPKEQFQVLSYHHIVLEDISNDDKIGAPSAALDALPARYVFYPANINVHKNHETLLVAWARFALRHEFPLVLIGDGTQVLNKQNQSVPTRNWREDTIRGLMDRLGLVEGRDLHVIGYVSDEDLIHIMKNATALIMPTYTEGFGLPVLEALVRGIPVLCSDIQVLHETLIGRTADVLWFDPYSPDDILAKVNLLLDNYDYYKKSAETGRNDPYPDWPDTAEQYVTVFKHAIQTKKF